MPEISRFFGIVISIHFNDHAPPHFHAQYGEHEAQISIENCQILQGSLPARALNLIKDWFVLHRTEIMEDWNLAVERKPLRKIEPLR